MKYKTPAAFRQALEERLNSRAQKLRMPVVRSRKIVCFERFISRVQADNPDRWLLKGGFALQLRLGNRARTTVDVDLGANLSVLGEAELSSDAIRSELVRAAVRDLGDHFKYEVGSSSKLDLEAGPVRAYRFSVRTLLAGRPFEGFRVDAGIGDPIVSPPVDLMPSGLLEFAELPPVSFRAIAPVQHFAEKVHALTRKWKEATNSRARDLIDLMLLLDAGLSDAGSVRHAVKAIFDSRKTHGVPRELDDPPASWQETYPKLANEIGIAEGTAEKAMGRLRAFWKGLGWQEI